VCEKRRGCENDNGVGGLTRLGCRNAARISAGRWLSKRRVTPFARGQRDWGGAGYEKKEVRGPGINGGEGGQRGEGRRVGFVADEAGTAGEGGATKSKFRGENGS